MSDSTASAFVAGATGYTGREVVACLRARGLPTVAHVRPASSDGERWVRHFGELGARVDRSPWQADAFRAALEAEPPSVVFALLGTTRARARDEGMSSEEGYRKVDYGLTRLLLEAAVATETRPRFVYLSSMGASPETRNPYLRARADFEVELRESGLPWTIARPAFVSGPDREESRPGERILARLADGALSLARLFGARSLAARYHSMTGRRLAEALVRDALSGDGGNRVLEASDLR